jgi:hypothetical protein
MKVAMQKDQLKMTPRNLPIVKVGLQKNNANWQAMKVVHQKSRTAKRTAQIDSSQKSSNEKNCTK